MIKSFKCPETQKIWKGEISKNLPYEIQQVARRKLRMLNNAENLYDLTIPPANRLESLKGNRAGQFSIGINNQWRLCFIWNKEDAFDVEIIDYH